MDVTQVAIHVRGGSPGDEEKNRPAHPNKASLVGPRGNVFEQFFGALLVEEDLFEMWKIRNLRLPDSQLLIVALFDESPLKAWSVQTRRSLGCRFILTLTKLPTDPVLGTLLLLVTGVFLTVQHSRT